MKKCDPRAYVACMYKSSCGPLGEAQFADGSECEQFNEEMVSRPRTNADTIRSMSDEELAVEIMCPYHIEPDMCNRTGTCVECCLEWLQQPAEEDEKA